MSIQSLLEQMRTRQSDQTGPDTPAPLPSFTPSGLTIGPMGGTTPASYVSNISGQVDGLKNALMSSAKNLGSIASGLSNPGGLGGMAITSNAIRPDSDFSLSELAPIVSAAAPEFAEGGAVNNVYKRPMFMQQGGAATPRLPTPMANMPMARAPSGAMPPMRPSSAPMAPAPRIPAAPSRPTAPDAQGIASMVADKAKADLATAQGPEQLINAFRGNQKPIAARYQELAEYVGPNDAGRTPTSVLTMVQPTIMMTEKGAADSGIGQLMAGMPEANAPMQGDMGAGIMRQAPVRMDQGGDPRMADFQNQQAFLQEALGLDPEALRRRARSRGVVQAGLQGLTRQPRLGESAAQQILPTIFEALGAGSEADMAVDQLMRQSVSTPAAQYALNQEQARKAAEAAAAVRAAELEDAKALEKFKAGVKGFDVDDIKRVQMPSGDVRNYDVSKPADRAAYVQDMRGGGIEIGVKGEIPEALEPPDAIELTPAAIEGQFADSELLNQLQNTQVTMIPRDKLTRLNAAIQQKTQKVLKPTGTVGPNGNEIMTEEFDELPNEWNDAILAARRRGIPVQLPEYLQKPEAQPVGGQQQVSLPGAQPDGEETGTFSLQELNSLELPEYGEQPTQFEQAIMSYPIANQFGTWAAIDKTINTKLPALFGILGPGAAEAAAGTQAENDAEAALKGFEVISIEAMLAARPGRASDETRRQLQQLFPDTNSAFTNRVEALGKYEFLRGVIEEDLRQTERLLNQNQSQGEREKFTFVKSTLEKQLLNLQAITNALQSQGSGATQTVPEDRFKRILEGMVEQGGISAPYTISINTGN